MKWPICALMTCSLVLLVACATALPTPSPSTLPTPTGSPLPSPSGSDSPLPAPTIPTPRQIDPVESARSDLAQRLGLPVDEIEVRSVERVEMPASAGLGCPGDQSLQPGIVLGSEIVLVAGERTFVYRAHAARLVFCGAQ